jgi:hypothetical protein
MRARWADARVQGCGLLGDHLGQLAALCQVEPSREVIAVAEQDPAPDRVVVLELVVRAGELVDQRKVEGVALLGAVQADQQHVAAAFEGQCGLLRQRY